MRNIFLKSTRRKKARAASFLEFSAFFSTYHRDIVHLKNRKNFTYSSEFESREKSKGSKKVCWCWEWWWGWWRQKKIVSDFCFVFSVFEGREFTSKQFHDENKHRKCESKEHKLLLFRLLGGRTCKEKCASAATYKEIIETLYNWLQPKESYSKVKQ